MSDIFLSKSLVSIDWIYIVTVVLGSDLLIRTTMSQFLRKNSVYTVLIFAFIIGIIFWFLSSKPEDLGEAVKNMIVNYCIATSLYELIIKRIKNLLQYDNSEPKGIEPNPV